MVPTKRRAINHKEILFVVAALVPGLLFYGVYNLYGIFMTFQYSTLDWTGISQNTGFVGLANYLKLFKDPMMGVAVKNNLILMITSIVIQLPFALLLALALNSAIKGTRFFRTIFFLPMLFSTVATGIMWQLFFDPMFGILAYVMQQVGLGAYIIGFLADVRTAMPAVLFVICWQFIPFYMIILKAGLTNISVELYEAATIDGANRWQAFWKITLPLMAPTLRTSAVMSMVGSLKYFDLVYIMTGGGPSGATELMATYMYKKGFVEFGMGYASAIAGLMFIICFVFACVFLYVTRVREAH
ncbi:Lactose transport system permease protein LacF [bioreactor metagenome]|jgi:raffinose/stachyose/melibiose transport system permease protein|uniref:Lactose transport system permease protein LacF n=1 Tax=bioreactor metagenome TaxID=1076179 RepID=A0A644YM23_9ZZZZ|nr:sugar ABC transporter permease [Sphaerochaeta sp.]